LIDRNKLIVAYLIFHFYRDSISGDSVWQQIGFWRINHRFEVWVEGLRQNCQVLQAADGLIARIGQSDYRISSIRKAESFVEAEINNQQSDFYCLENEKETRIATEGFEFLVRSNALPAQAVVIRNNLASEKIFQNLICADLFGKVLNLSVRKGDLVKSGEKLLTLESMKTEIHILSPVDGRIKSVNVKVGNAVTEKQLLIELEEVRGGYSN